MPLVKDSWVHALLHERFGSEGFLEMWIDGQQITFFADCTNNLIRRGSGRQVARPI